MLNFRLPFVAPAPRATRHRAVNYELIFSKPDATTPRSDNDVCLHVDYNLHSLGVNEFEHYISQDERGERFHIR